MAKKAPPHRAASADGRRARRAPAAWPYAIALAAAAVACYANALNNPFVFDDIEAIVENPHIRTLWPLWLTLSAPSQSVEAGRPLVALSFALNYAVGGTSPFGYHAFNLALHIAAALLLFGVVRRALRFECVPPSLSESADSVAFVASLLWTVHPLLSETVNYVAQRSESMAGVCFLATLYASIRTMHEPRRVLWPAFAVLCAAIGMTSKESMATAPLVVLAFDAIFVSRSPRRALADHRRLYVGLAASWIVLAAINIGGPRFRSAGLGSGVSPFTYLLNQGEMIVTYLKLTVWPSPLVIDYGVTKPIAPDQAAWPLTIVLLLLALTAWALWRKPLAGFLALCFWITLAPSSSIVPIATEVGAERRMYLPLAALTILVVVAIWQWIHAADAAASQRARLRYVLGAMAVAIVALGTRTILRNQQYGDPIELWTEAVEWRPHGRARHNLAIALIRAGRRSDGLRELAAATRDSPVSHYALGAELLAQRDYQQAAGEFQQFLSAMPDDYRAPDAAIGLGKSLLAERRFADAADAFRRALAMHSASPDVPAGLADALLALDRFQEAAERYREYVALAPDNPAGHSNLGRALIGAGNLPDALKEFEKAYVLAPANPSNVLNYGYALTSTGRLDDAIDLYRRAIQTNPGHAQLLSALGLSLTLRGQTSDGLDLLRRAMTLDAADARIRDDYRQALAFNATRRRPPRG